MPKRPNSVGPILEKLKEHNGQVTEAEAAQLLGVSPVWFRHYFKAQTRMSFREARTAAKLERGAALLQTAMTIPEISMALGYSDRSKFDKAFKRAYGTTPAAFRNAPKFRDKHGAPIYSYERTTTD
jgi:AraC-like DNA-binding protein